MQDKKTNLEQQTTPIQKRRETMADGRRYIIYYTFEKAGESEEKGAQSDTAENAEVSENV